VRLFDGDYDYYLGKREQEEVAAASVATKPSTRTLRQATKGASHATAVAGGPAKESGERGVPRRVHGKGAAAAAPQPVAPEVAGPKTKEQKRAEAEARNRAYRSTKERKDRLRVLDVELVTAQKRHDELISLMAKPELYADPAAFDSAIAEYNALKARLPKLEDEWMALTEEIEHLSANEE